MCIRDSSETVIVPIAGIILTFVMCYELIQLIIEKNNLHDFDTWIFFKWIFKTFCAVLIVTNTWNIVMAVFDVAQNVVSQSAGVIISDAGIDISGAVSYTHLSCISVCLTSKIFASEIPDNNAISAVLFHSCLAALSALISSALGLFLPIFLVGR